MRAVLLAGVAALVLVLAPAAHAAVTIDGGGQISLRSANVARAANPTNVSTIDRPVVDVSGPFNLNQTAAAPPAHDSSAAGTADGSSSSTLATSLTNPGGGMHLTYDGSVTATGTNHITSFPTPGFLGSGQADATVQVRFTVTTDAPFTLSANFGPVPTGLGSSNPTAVVELFRGDSLSTFVTQIGAGESKTISGTLAADRYQLLVTTSVAASAQGATADESHTFSNHGNVDLQIAGTGPCADGVPTVQVGFAQAEGCFVERKDAQGQPTGVFETDQKSWVGGFEVQPRPSGKLVVDTRAVALRSEGAGTDIVLDGFAAPFGVEVLPVGVPEASFDLNQAGTIEKLLLSLPVKGKLKASWSDGGKSSTLDGEVSLSKLVASFGLLVSSAPNGSELSGKLKFKGTNGTGFVVSQAEAKIDELSVIPFAFKVPNTLALKNVSFKYERKDGKPFWRGAGMISIPFKKDHLDIGGSVFLFDGSLAGAGLSVDGINKEIPETPLFLQKLEGELVFLPKFGLNAGIGATFGPRLDGKQIATLDGNVGSGALVSSSDCPNGLDPFKIDAKLTLNPLDNLSSQLAKVDMTMRTCGYVGPIVAQDATGKGSIEFGNIVSGTVLGYEGTQSGFVGQTGLDLEGGVTLKIPTLPTIAGQAIISDQGIAACGRLNASYQGGFGYRWGQSGLPTLFSACDLAPFRTTAIPRSARDAAGPPSVPLTVRGGLPVVGFSASAAAGPPRVRVTGPGGVSFTSPAAGGLRTKRVVIVPVAHEKATYVLVTRPAGGTWHLASLDAGTPLTRAAMANGLPQPRVTGKLKGRGKKLSFAYRLHRIAGQRVRLFERGPGGVDRLLGVARGERGTIGFVPTVAPKRGRKVVAEVSQNGLPRAELTVARFTAPAPVKLHKPNVSAKRTSAALTVTWKKVAGAARYLVELRGGSVLLDRILTTRAHLTFKSVPGTGTLTVTVKPLADAIAPGPATQLEVKARR